MSAGPTTVAETITVLRGYGKSNRGAPAYSRFVNRPLGRVLAAIAYQRGLTPNGVTGLSAACSAVAIAGLALLPPSFAMSIPVCLLLVLGYALDSADGQLARLRGGGSAAGEWLDHVVDCVKINALHLTVLISLYRFTDVDRRWLLVPVAYTLVANLFFFSFVLLDLLKRTRGGRPDRAGESASVVRSLLSVPTDYGFLCVAFLLYGAPTLFLPIYAVFLLGNAGYLALGLPKWFRDMTHLDRGGTS